MLSFKSSFNSKGTGMSFKGKGSFKRIANKFVLGGKVNDLVTDRAAGPQVNGLLSVLTVKNQASKWRVASQESAAYDSTSFSRGAPGTIGASREVQWKETAAAMHKDDRVSADALLRKACAAGVLNRVRLLIDQGLCNVNSYDEAFERTPLHFAALHGHTAIVRLLITRGARHHAKDLSSMTPLHIAAEAGHTAVIDALVECGADLSARSSIGNTALHHSAYNAHKQATLRLLALMVDRQVLVENERGDLNYSNWRNNWGKTPADLAKEKGHDEILRLLEPRAHDHRPVRRVKKRPAQAR
uniref:Ankyrin repeat domain-containing protein n=1 Tax=Haptolina brevifila TaxID=156173 RepID=A0A7S2IHV8_9EUKA|mmetsp:Transcript_66073/g.131040  ORF Transcript_66073/g.131040 Transcript_66073/m.131040 type:complete len:300 (+) Transcript_66073:37-936(+)